MRRFADDEGVGDLPLQLEIIEGNTVGEILATAERLPSDLLVMGTHGRSGFERLVLGSSPKRSCTTCLVLSVPRGVKDAVPAAPVVFKDILCAIDFSECSMNALNARLFCPGWHGAAFALHDAGPGGPAAVRV